MKELEGLDLPLVVSVSDIHAHMVLSTKERFNWPTHKKWSNLNARLKEITSGASDKFGDPSNERLATINAARSTQFRNILLAAEKVVADQVGEPCRALGEVMDLLMTVDGMDIRKVSTVCAEGIVVLRHVSVPSFDALYGGTFASNTSEAEYNAVVGKWQHILETISLFWTSCADAHREDKEWPVATVSVNSFMPMVCLSSLVHPKCFGDVPSGTPFFVVKAVLVKMRQFLRKQMMRIWRSAYDSWADRERFAAWFIKHAGGDGGEVAGGGSGAGNGIVLPFTDEFPVDIDLNVGSFKRLEAVCGSFLHAGAQHARSPGDA